MPAEPLRVAVAQCRAEVGTPSYDPRPANLAMAEAAIAAAAKAGADLVIFGEMFLTGLRTDASLPRWALRPHDSKDATVCALSAACERHDVGVLTGTATLGPDGTCRNSVILVDRHGHQATYHKQHLAQIVLPDGYQADEFEYYQPGRSPIVVATRWGRIGLQICYEVTFPELARCAAIEEADLIINCTASIAGTEQLWAAMARARAFENGTYFVVASVVGDQGDDHYFGGSSVFDPHGECVAQASYDAVDLVVADVDVGLSRRTRKEMNVLGSRRPELYGAITRPVASRNEQSAVRRPTEPARS